MRVKFLFAWYDLWIGFFWDKKKQWLYFLPLPTIGIIIKFNLFKNWMDELREVAFKWDSRQYPMNSGWVEEYFKKTYYDKGFTPELAWKEYTTMVN